MSIPQTVAKFLDRNKARYTVITHPYTESSMESAEAAHISGEKIAKGVLLKDEGGYILAVLPATHSLQINALRSFTGRELELAPEAELENVFPDCAPGAVPAIGPAYGVETLVDEALTRQEELYFEAGDHELLLKVSEPKFEAMLQPARFGAFSAHKP
jgi:Ala-tRNA(Pro) deacylase